MCHLYVALEGRKVGAIPMQVNVVEVAATIAGVDHLSQPVQALARASIGGYSGERLLDGEGVDVLLVPRRRNNR